MKINFIGNIHINKDTLKNIKNHVIIILNRFFYKYEIDIFLTDNENIKILNNKFRNINSPTDVLSFPMYYFKNFIPLEKMHKNTNNKIFLGDIIISIEKIFLQAVEFNNTFEDEFIYLFIHSMLHLVGYDHYNIDDKNIMRKKEKEILDLLIIKY